MQKQKPIIINTFGKLKCVIQNYNKWQSDKSDTTTKRIVVKWKTYICSGGWCYTHNILRILFLSAVNIYKNEEKKKTNFMTFDFIFFF